MLWNIQKKLYFLLTLIFFISSCGSDKIEDNGSQTTSSSHAVHASNNNILGKDIWAKCMGCHGKNGEKKALGKSDIIGGEAKDAILYQLKEYRAGNLNQYGMGGLMKGQTQLTNRELEAVARYIETLSGVE